MMLPDDFIVSDLTEKLWFWTLNNSLLPVYERWDWFLPIPITEVPSLVTLSVFPVATFPLIRYVVFAANVVGKSLSDVTSVNVVPLALMLIAGSAPPPPPIKWEADIA